MLNLNISLIYMPNPSSTGNYLTNSAYTCRTITPTMPKNNWIYVQVRGKIQYCFSRKTRRLRTMPARQFSTKHRRRNARSASPKCNGTQLNLLLKAIETERDNLSRAESLLGCLRI